MSDFKAKMYQIDFGWGSAPDPLAGFEGPTSKGEEGREKGGERGGREKGGERRPFW